MMDWRQRRDNNQCGPVTGAGRPSLGVECAAVPWPIPAAGQPLEQVVTLELWQNWRWIRNLVALSKSVSWRGLKLRQR